MELLNSLVGQINDILWSYVLIILLIGAGIIFTIRTKFVLAADRPSVLPERGGAERYRLDGDLF